MYIQKDTRIYLFFYMKCSVGVGFDTKGAGSKLIRGPSTLRSSTVYVIEDSRKGKHYVY